MCYNALRRIFWLVAQPYSLRIFARGTAGFSFNLKSSFPEWVLHFEYWKKRRQPQLSLRLIENDLCVGAKLIRSLNVADSIFDCIETLGEQDVVESGLVHDMTTE